MKVIKNINNNISLCLDSRNNEVVAFGKGIGFTKPPYDVPVHSVTLTAGSPLWALLGKDTLAVNSLHHQAIRKLAPTLQVMALSEDGIPEAICLPGKKFVWAVQWHPEFSFPVNADSRKIFAAFVGAC